MLLITILALVIMTIAAAWDIKTLEVPDWLNYGGIAAGLGINGFLSIYNLSWIPIAYSLTGILAGFLIGCLMYYTGQWGGGDAKLLMAIGALIGVPWGWNNFSTAFMLNLILMGALWGIAYLIFLAAIRYKQTYRIFRTLKAQEKYSKAQLISAITAGLLIVSAFISKDFAIPIVSLALIGYLLFYLVLLVRSVELTSMHKWVTPDKLVEGDWLVHTISDKGNIIAAPSNTGLKKEEIQDIQKMHAKKKIGKICVKYGIPFTPAFLLSFIVTLAAGNILLYAISL